jgi:L-alanine-DL-glutamate epimerase-like enolase superfamily enzyme
MMPGMKVTAIETFVVNTGFKRPRPWHFCAVRTDEGLTGYSEFGSEGITRGLVGLVQDFGARLIGKDPTARMLKSMQTQVAEARALLA